MSIRINIRSLVEELEWIESATPKEIEDEKLILNEELDEIAQQLKDSDGTNWFKSSWRSRAIIAAKHKRKKLQLIAKMSGVFEDAHVCLSGELKNSFDILIAKNESLSNKNELLQRRIINLTKENVSLKRKIKKLNSK